MGISLFGEEAGGDCTCLIKYDFDIQEGDFNGLYVPCEFDVVGSVV